MLQPSEVDELSNMTHYKGKAVAVALHSDDGIKILTLYVMLPRITTSIPRP